MGSVNLIDVNGDGLSDLCGDPSGAGSWAGGQNCWMSAEQVESGRQYYVSADTSIPGPDFFAPIIHYPDFNGDGKLDICVRNSSAHFGDDYTCRLFTSNNFQQDGWATTIEIPSWTANSGLDDYKSHGFPDVNGDGRSDIVRVNLDGDLEVYITRGWQTDVMDNIDNGIGGGTVIEYTPSTTWAQWLMPLGTVFQTVTKVTVDDGQTGLWGDPLDTIVLLKNTIIGAHYGVVPSKSSLDTTQSIQPMIWLVTIRKQNTIRVPIPPDYPHISIHAMHLDYSTHNNDSII